MSTLLVASAGGHLMELHELAPRLGLGDDVHWATFASDQSRSLLAGRTVHYVPDNPPRDVRGMAANARRAVGLLRRERFDAVVSTGAGIALSFLPAARALGAHCHYIESAARTDAPSLSGRLLERVPGIALYAQSEGLVRGRWRHRGSVFDAFAPGPEAPRAIERVVVTVGTMPFGFRRLVEPLAGLLAGAQVLWQTGATDVTGLALDARPFVAAGALRAAIADADLVVAHGGVGSALTALEAGRCPVLVPRSRAASEHVDDHQGFIVGELVRRGLALTASPERLDRPLLEAAAARSVRRTTAPPFALDL